MSSGESGDFAAAQNPYQASPQTLLASGEDADQARKLAGRDQRLGARIIDLVLLLTAIVGAVLLAGLTDTDGPAAATGATRVLLVLAACGITVGFLLAANLYLLATRGQTPGKFVLRIRIVRADGSRASLGRILLLRMLVPELLGLLCGLFSLFDLLMIFQESRRCLHDHMADTIVIAD